MLVEGDVFSLEFLNRLKALHEELSKLDMEIPSLGERKADRDKRRHGEAVATPKEKKKAKKAGDDGFGGGGDDFAAFGGGEDDWSDEGGGSIIEETRSLINARRTRSSAEGIEVGEWLDPMPSAEELPALKALILADPTLVGNVVGRDGRHAVIMVRTQFMSEQDSIRVNAEVTRIAQAHEAPGFHTQINGMHALSASLNTLMMSDLQRMLVASIVLMVGVLIFLFRHPLGVAVPLMVVMFAAANTFGMMALSGIYVTMLSNILPAFLFCVGLGDSVHLISVYRDGLRQGLDSHSAVVHAVSHTGVPVFFTSLTTMVGLASFKLASMEAIQDMGMAGAFGVGMAMIHSLVFLPIMLSFNKKARLGARPPGKPDFLDRWLLRCNDLSGLRGDAGTGPVPPVMRVRRNRVLLLTLVLLGASVLGMRLVRVWHNPLSWMPPDTPIVVATNDLDAHVGGTATVNFLIDGAPGKGVKDRDLLIALDHLAEHISAYRDAAEGAIVGNIISVADVVKETNRALHGGDPAAYQIPETQRGVADAFFLFENAGPDELRLLATNDLSRGQMTIRIKWLEAWSYRPLIAHIEEGLQKFLPEGARVQATGSVYTLLTTIGSLIGDLLRSFGTAFLAITILMTLLLRSLKLGLIAMVPNLLPIAFIMGIMGVAGIPIDMNTLLIASIAIGIAVDDTIHFLHHFRLYHDRSANVEDAIGFSMRHSGRAMVSTSLILLIGFSAYMGSQMVNIVRFGLLVGLTSAMALIVDLIVTPALLRFFYRRPAAQPQEVPDVLASTPA
ncbi:MAG: MMPL family transporter [bacterium]